MTKITREYEPSIIDSLKDNFVEDGSYSRDIMMAEFKLSMRYYKDDILVLVGRDGESVVGHLIAFRPQNRSYVMLDQVVNRVVDPKFAKEGIGLLIDWCKEIGATELRGETERHSVAEKCMRHWEFKEHGVVLSRKIDND